MKYALLAALALVLAVPTFANVEYAGGDGSDIGHAIVITGAKNEIDGVASEYRWLVAHTKDCKKQEQSLLSENGKDYDILTIRCPEGARSFYFDITDFFGKM